MSRRKSTIPPTSPVASDGDGVPAMAVEASQWQPLLADPQMVVGRGEVLRRMLKTAVVIVVLPILCVLLLLPFFYRNNNAQSAVSLEFAESQIYSLPEYDEASDTKSSLYEWLRFKDPRQFLLPDTHAGFSKFLQFEPHYAAAAFPVYQSAKAAGQPQYDELFRRIAPQFPRSIVNEQIHQFWQQVPSTMQVGAHLQVRDGAQRPVWRLADGMVVVPAEEPALTSEELAYWKSPETRSKLAKVFQNSGGRTLLELQVLPAVTLPQVTLQGMTQDEPRIAVNRVVLRRSCGDAVLDQAAISALRRLMSQHGAAMTTAVPGNYPVQVDWSCW
ncbi:MAG: hypothetical protein J5654_04580 [Victivallales bacterium]|nr:hypothetical protein [Victivallales bacterium]